MNDHTEPIHHKMDPKGLTPYGEHPIIHLEVDTHLMVCYLSIPPTDRILQPKELFEYIKNNGIVFGIQQDSLKQAYLSHRDKLPVERLLIAHGSDVPENPEQELLQLSVEPFSDVVQNQVLGKITTKIISRTNIKGERKRIAFLDEASHIGNCVSGKKIDPHTVEVFATMDGVVSVDAKRLNVYPFDHKRMKLIKKDGEGKILLSIKPKDDNDPPYSHNALREYSEAKSIPYDSLNWDRVKELIRKANRAEEVVAIEIQNKATKSPIKVDIGTSPDDMFAHLSVRFPEGTTYNLSFEQVKRAIKAENVTYGFEWDAIEQLVKDINADTNPDGTHNDLVDHVFAFGNEAVEGMEGDYEIIVELPEKDIIRNKATLSSQVVKKGALVRKDELLAVQSLGVPGIDGRNVKNKVIKSKTTMNRQLKPAQNVRLIPEEQDPMQVTFYSDTDGMVYFYPDTGEITVLPYRDAGCEIVVSKDKMEASLILKSFVGEGRKLDAKMVEGVIEHEGIMLTSQAKATIKNMINRINREESTEIEQVIASGALPRNGKDGKLIYIYKPKEPQFSITEEDTVDYKTLTGTTEVKQGASIGYIVPPDKDSRDGFDVYGNKIPAKPGKEAQVKMGNGIKLDDTRGKLIATKNGRFVMKNDQPCIVETLEVEEVRSHIEFQGVVVIRGHVEKGYKIHAGDGIYIFGSVSGCDLKSEGDILVNGGIIGSDIYSEGNIYARSIQGSNLVAKQNVKVIEEIIQSEVKSDGLVSLFQRGKGAIHNSVIQAFKGLEARHIGNGRHPNKIIIGHSLKLTEKQERLKHIEKQLEKEDIRGDEVRNEINQLKFDIKALTDYAESLEPEVKVLHKVMLPTTIIIKQKSFELTQEISGVIFHIDATDKIVMVSI